MLSYTEDLRELENFYNPYLIEEGKHGNIYKVSCTLDANTYIRKEVKWQTLPASLQRTLQDEVRILKEVHHPNIIAYHQVINDIPNKTMHLIMQHCPQEITLKSLITTFKDQGKMISEGVIWELLEQLTMALFRCHKGTNHPRDLADAPGHYDGSHFLHRDLRPENIFLYESPNFTMKLGNFGVRGHLESGETTRKAFVGPRSYMCPEFLSSQPYTEKSEVWSFGCIAHELCSKNTTFQSERPDDFSLNLCILIGFYGSIPGVYSSALRELIEGCLKTDPGERLSINQIADNPYIVMARGERKLKMARAKWEDILMDVILTMDETGNDDDHVLMDK